MQAEIIPFPQQAVQRCSSCEHSLSGVRGIYCTMWHEEVDESNALDCAEFEAW